MRRAIIYIAVHIIIILLCVVFFVATIRLALRLLLEENAKKLLIAACDELRIPENCILYDSFMITSFDWANARGVVFVYKVSEISNIPDCEYIYVYPLARKDKRWYQSFK